MRSLRFIVFAAALAAAFAASAAEGAWKSPADREDVTLKRGETRETLDPALFRDYIVQQAYRTAKDIPTVLDSIYCYCKCEESPAFRHKSVLSCYVDNHAAV